MATIKVLPLPDTTSMRGSWQVKKSGRRVSSHRKKSAAKRKAKQKASSGDTLQIRRSNGTIQSTTTVR